jgi:hypothetical protein
MMAYGTLRAIKEAGQLMPKDVVPANWRKPQAVSPVVIVRR